MKNFTLLFLFAFILLAFGSCSGRRYHNERVHIKVKPIEKAISDRENTTVTQELLKEELSTAADDAGVMVSNDSVLKPLLKPHRVFDPKIKFTDMFRMKKLRDRFSSFSDQLKDHAKLLQSEDAQVRSLAGWIIGLILLLVFFAIFLALALIFLYVISSVVPYTVFLIIAIALAVATVLFLIFGLAGLFTPAG